MVPDLEHLNDWLATREEAVGGVRPECTKEVIWANGVAKTPIAVVYIHGFSASKGEVRPLPDLVAQALGANLYYARLTGHGQDGAAMGRAQLRDWDADIKEALSIGAALGDEVLVIGCSTGCTLLTTALAQGVQVKGIVHLSPNFGLRHRFAQVPLDLPWVRIWGPWIAGKERAFEPISEANAKLWTIKYDTQAVFTMGEAVRAARASAIEAIQTPAYFAYANEDQIVSPKRIRQVMARWGGPIREDVLRVAATDHAMAHVMAGDVFSPDQTAPLAARIIDWARTI